VDLELAGRVVVVTGASRGIGRAIAQAFAAEGCAVSICARSTGPLAATAAELQAAGAVVYHDAFDVADAAALDRFIDTTHERLGRIDVLVANASLMLDDDTDDAWQRSFDADLLHAVRASRRVAPIMRAQRSGAIVLIASISGMEPDGPGPYGPLKAALISHGRQLADDLGRYGVRANVVAPGSIDFPGGFWDTIRRESPAVYAETAAASALRRHGTPEEVAAAVVFLASARASLITGTVVRTDGGQWRATH
jgi:3-oxoacyl-[acyl-carrier protein] reductase